MTRANQLRKPVISQELRNMLRPYLRFRHVVRHAYPFDLDWPKMAPLTQECGKAFERLQKELGSFLQTLPMDAGEGPP